MTLLVVDDERNLRESLSEALEEAGYNVLTAANGKEAYAMIQSHALRSFAMRLAYARDGWGRPAEAVA